MRRKLLLPNMVQAIAVLTVLKMLTNAQTTCNHGLGRVVYERIPDHQLQGFNDDIVKDTMPPFRMLEKCQDLCLRDRTAVNNLVRTCTSFNFQPGVRIASFSGTPEYEESICYLTQEQAHPEGIGNLVLVPNSVHFTEVCLSSLRIDRECPNRRYVFERHPRKKLKLLASDHKEIQASNRTDCEERCLNENAFVCRSVTYNSQERTCSMTRFTRRSHPELMQDDPNSDYLENTCLSPERRCDGLAVFVKEENKRLGGPFEVDMYVNISLEECQNLCLRAEKYFCRSIEYDDRRRECIISEEDSVSQKDDLRTSSSLSRHLFDLVCLDARSNEFPDNSVTSHLFSDGRRPDTAFQRYRNSRLGGDFHSEITSRTLSECLDECLRQASFQCRSAVYSERFRVCRLSRFNQRDGHRIIYDADYDYYDNLMPEGAGDGLGQDSFYSTQGRPPTNPNYPANNYPNYPANPYPSNPNYPSSTYPNPGYNTPNSWGYGGGPNGYPSNYPSNNYPSNNYPGNNYPSSNYPSNNYPSNNYPGQGGYHGGGYQSYPGRYGGGSVGGSGYSNADRFGSGTPYGPPGPVSSGPPYGGGGYPTSNYPSNYPQAPPSGYPPQPGSFPGGPNYPANNDIFGPNKFTSRCDESDNFRQVGVRLRLRRPFLRRYVSAPTLAICERECADSRDFNCRSFNYRSSAPGAVGPYSAPAPGPAERDNCELSDKDSRELDVNNPAYFEISGDYDYFERSPGRQGQGQDCLDVSQQCSEDGMEFALKTPEGFFGRIYTYGFYDRCFFRGNGGTINVLRISGAQGYPDCGTQRYGDTMTNIVVVQFSDFVQTGRDKRYNLTCLFRGPGEAVVTSGYIGAGSGSPIPIEYLPAENSLSSKVRLMILYQNRPTTTIAVGDPLTFRLEAQDNYNYPTDIFATNVIARDPYSGRSVQLIDRFGCPVDNFVFPGLDRSREGDGLEARFNAFKIPESNFLVFEATVKTCRDGCQPAYCTGQTGRSEPSFGRRRRRDTGDFNETLDQLMMESNDEPLSLSSTSSSPEIISEVTVTSTPMTKPVTVAVTKPAIKPISYVVGKPVATTASKPLAITTPIKEQAWPSQRGFPGAREAGSTEEQEISEDVIRELIVVVDNRGDIAADKENLSSNPLVRGMSDMVEAESLGNGDTESIHLPCITTKTLVTSLISLGMIVVFMVAVLLYVVHKWISSRKENELYVDPREASTSNKFLAMLKKSQSGENKRGLVSRLTGNKPFISAVSNSAHPAHWTDAPIPSDNFGSGGSVTKRFSDLFKTTSSNGNFTMAAPTAKYTDPSEPIYTDPSLFELERSRSFRSITGSNVA